MIKLTQKNTNKFLKEFKCDIFVINEDGTRGTHYGSVSPLVALTFIAKRNQEGKTCIVTKAGLNLHGEVYPSLGVMEASSFSMRDKSFGKKIKLFSIDFPYWYR